MGEGLREGWEGATWEKGRAARKARDGGGAAWEREEG